MPFKCPVVSADILFETVLRVSSASGVALMALNIQKFCICVSEFDT